MKFIRFTPNKNPYEEEGSNHQDNGWRNVLVIVIIEYFAEDYVKEDIKI